MRNTNNCALPTTLTQPRSQKGNNVNAVPEIPTAKAKTYHKNVTLLGSASVTLICPSWSHLLVTNLLQ